MAKLITTNFTTYLVAANCSKNSERAIESGPNGKVRRVITKKDPKTQKLGKLSQELLFSSYQPVNSSAFRATSSENLESSRENRVTNAKTLTRNAACLTRAVFEFPFFSEAQMGC